MKKRTILLLFLLILSIHTLNINVQITAEDNDYRSNSLELTPHDTIEITSDSDFEVFPGTGTEIDPYVIEGYNITTTSKNGICIHDSTKYFIVRNCYVDALSYGIYIYGIAGCTATVINNTCSNNSGAGIRLLSGSSTVANNTCNNNEYGIYLLGSGSSIVANNTCSNNNRYGIYLDSSGSSTVANNTFTNCGLCIDEDTINAYISYTVENNWVNGKKLGYYTNLDSTIIDETVYGQLILVNCTNVTVRDQMLNNATTGLFLYSCTFSTIINNTCNNNGCGIFLDFSSSSTITNNTCNNNGCGILLYSSDSSTITKNTCNNNDSGISLYESGSSTVASNTCSNNNNVGISLEYSDSSTVANNTCCNNRYGIYLSSSDFCVITYNLLQENEKYGVYFSFYSDDNLIHHNTFVDNNLGGTSQAFNDGCNNYWYDSATQEGNYWSDWSGIGSYSIDGSFGNDDLYPLDDPVEHTTTEHTSVESTTDENPLNFTFTLLLLVVLLMLTRTISKKDKKK